MAVALLCSGYGTHGGEPAEPPQLTLEAIFTKAEFKTEDWGPARWLKDGSGYTTLEKAEAYQDNKDTQYAKDVVYYEPKSGQREVWLTAANLVPENESQPLKIEAYEWSDDATKLLIQSNAERVWRQNTRGDFWVYDRTSRKLKKLGGNAPPASLMFATFSPDGRRVAYVHQNDLYVQNLADLQVIRLTADGSETLINGTSDWAYEEEFYLRKAFRWSPDSQRIAYWQFDSSGVREFHLVNYTTALYPKITSFRYPKVGTINSACRVGVVKATGGATTWFKTNRDARDHYIPEMQWAPNSRQVIFQQLNRLQNTNWFTRGTVASGETRALFEDRDAAWVEVTRDWHWLDKGRRFLCSSERDGWRHLYAASASGDEPVLLTPGDYDTVGIEGVDEKGGWLYFIASPKAPTQRYLYRAPLAGGGLVERVTPEGQPGTHSYQMSEDCRWAFHTYSSFGTPPVIDLVQLPEHKSVRVLSDNASLRGKLQQAKASPGEFFRVKIEDGVALDGWCIKPPEFDPARRYPLFFYVYGEPAGQTAVDRWGGDNYLWHCLLAQRGYVVMNVDNRGTSAPRGRVWRKCVYRQVGILASADQAAAARQILKDRPYLDAARVGIWGWSGGGSMTLNALFRYPDLYHTGMAIAFVSDQRYYDTIYQERYMGLPDDNEEGFKQGSPITFADRLEGNLLLVYGTGDDNCHYQNCEALVNELIKHNKQFSMMSYPNRTHSINEGENTRRHLYETLTRYLTEHLSVGGD